MKSLRAGRVNLRDSYAEVRPARSTSSACTSVPTSRATSGTTTRCGRASCSCTRREIDRLTGKVKRGLHPRAHRVYFSGGHAKVELGLARGKRQYDKRADLARRDADRDMERALKRRQTGATSSGARRTPGRTPASDATRGRDEQDTGAAATDEQIRRRSPVSPAGTGTATSSRKTSGSRTSPPPWSSSTRWPSWPRRRSTIPTSTSATTRSRSPHDARRRRSHAADIDLASVIDDVATPA